MKQPNVLHLISVLTVPMRNGNFNSSNVSRIELFSSYRTYEEWKLECEHLYHPHFFGSYRTYEEWKRVKSLDEFYEHASSYRTYEEWKHFI